MMQFHWLNSWFPTFLACDLCDRRRGSFQIQHNCKQSKFRDEDEDTPAWVQSVSVWANNQHISQGFINLLSEHTEMRDKRGKAGGKWQNEESLATQTNRLTPTETILLTPIQLVHLLFGANKHEWSSGQICANDARSKLISDWTHLYYRLHVY